MSNIRKMNVEPQIVVEDPEDYEPPELIAVIDDNGESKKYCPHDTIRIYPHYRLVKCRTCQAVLDPFEYLLSVGQKENGALSEARWLHYDVKHKKEEIERLKKEISKYTKQLKLAK